MSRLSLSQGRSNSYLGPRPVVVSFSGSRTSAYMPKQIVDAHGGELSDDIAGVRLQGSRSRPPEAPPSTAHSRSPEPGPASPIDR